MFIYFGTAWMNITSIIYTKYDWTKHIPPKWFNSNKFYHFFYFQLGKLTFELVCYRAKWYFLSSLSFFLSFRLSNIRRVFFSDYLPTQAYSIQKKILYTFLILVFRAFFSLSLLISLFQQFILRTFQRGKKFTLIGWILMSRQHWLCFSNKFSINDELKHVQTMNCLKTCNSISFIVESTWAISFTSIAHSHSHWSEINIFIQNKQLQYHCS